MQVDPQLTVAEFLSYWPETFPVFIKKHMLCIGCCMSVFDTLIEAASNYGFTWNSFEADLTLCIQTNQIEKYKGNTYE